MRCCICTLTLCLSLWLMPSCVAAQSPPASPAQTLTVAQAVQEALEKNLTLVAERYTINVAEARIITARLRPNPVLTLSSAFPDHKIFRSNINPYAEVAHLDWVFERGGKREARIAVAEQARSVAVMLLISGFTVRWPRLTTG